MPQKPSIILFDGVCNLCAWSVRFIMERDPTGLFHFASLQSDAGQCLLVEHKLNPDSMDSFVLIENNHAYTESNAALHVAKHLSRPWPCLYICIIIPKFLRDPVYRFIAKNRYRWFGKNESCLMPTLEHKSRFL